MSAGNVDLPQAAAAKASTRGARFPGRYLQGPGCLGRLGSEAGAFAERALVLLDLGVFDLLCPVLEASFAGQVEATIVRHGGECSLREISRVSDLARQARAGVVIGVGGGKALDTAKAAADDLRLPVVVVPTIAASDAPCSALAVVYHDDGTVAFDRFLPRNPDLVLVDTRIIAGAPTRYLSAGIGDALATFYEAQSCLQSGALNCLGVQGSGVAYTIARACRDALFEWAAQAVIECDAHVAGPALERVVEANVLLSGIGFESGGVAAAHAIHHGLCELDETHGYLHGEKVTIGVLASLKLHGDAAEFVRVRDFCLSARLPTRLADVGLTRVTEAQLEIVARRACRPGEIMHNEPIPVTTAMVVEALRALA